MEYQGPRFMNGINFQNNVVSPIFHLSFHSSLLFILQFSFFNIYFTLKLQKTISYYHCELDFSNLNLGFRLCLMWYYYLNWRNYINRLLRRKMICKLSEASVERCIRKNNRENKWDNFFFSSSQDKCVILGSCTFRASVLCQRARNNTQCAEWKFLSGAGSGNFRFQTPRKYALAAIKHRRNAITKAT